MREIRQSGSEGGAIQTNVSFLPLSTRGKSRGIKPIEIKERKLDNVSDCLRRLLVLSEVLTRIFRPADQVRPDIISDNLE
jgi:hypothetical protein